jgi:hypothetical protein
LMLHTDGCSSDVEDIRYCKKYLFAEDTGEDGVYVG